MQAFDDLINVFQKVFSESVTLFDDGECVAAVTVGFFAEKARARAIVYNFVFFFHEFAG